MNELNEEYASGTAAVVFDKSKIRSVNAAFDPAKAASSKILAGGAAAAATAAATDAILDPNKPKTQE